MRETDFIRQNREKWEEFERLIGAENKDPEKLSDLFIEVTDDLSYSRTYYPNRSVRVYLNGIAQTVFQNIYRSKRSKVSPFKTFWVSRLPDTLWHVRKAMLWAAIIFVLSTVIGYVSSMYNEDFCAIIMGDGYVEMSESNVENGDPFAVYKDEHAMEMFFQIAWNNIRICFMVFVLGVLAGVGSAWVMMTNGIMFGAFMHFFAARGLLTEFSTVVMLHGTLELSMIVLSGAAGLTLGGGILFPRSYHRLQSLVLAARRGVMLMIPCTAFLLIAAFIESWITRHTEAPFAIRLMLVLVSLAIVLGYFVIYPWWRNRRGLIQELEDDQLQAERDYDIDYTTVKTNGKIFTEVFAFYKHGLRQLVRTALIGGVATAAGYFLIFGAELDWISEWGFLGMFFLFDIVWPWNEVGHLFSLDYEPLLFVPISLVGTLVFAGATWTFLKTKTGGRVPFKGVWIANAFTAVSLVLAPWFIQADWNDGAMFLAFLIAMFTYPIILTIYATANIEGTYFLVAMGRTFRLVGGSFGRKLGLFWVSLSIPWIALMSTTSILWFFIFQLVETFWVQSWMASETLAYLLFVAFAFFVMSLTFPLIVFGYHLFYYNLLEISEAKHLRARIEAIQFRSKAYGLEKE
ncbi:MAG: stage II sporulation protein M [Flavobacteriales bacterium]